MTKLQDGTQLPEDIRASVAALFSDGPFYSEVRTDIKGAAQIVHRDVHALRNRKKHTQSGFAATSVGFEVLE